MPEAHPTSSPPSTHVAAPADASLIDPAASLNWRRRMRIPDDFVTLGWIGDDDDDDETAHDFVITITALALAGFKTAGLILSGPRPSKAIDDAMRKVASGCIWMRAEASPWIVAPICDAIAVSPVARPNSSSVQLWTNWSQVANVPLIIPPSESETTDHHRRRFQLIQRLIRIIDHS